jgi:hypothetical protein
MANDPQIFLRRAEAARALTGAGYPTASATLATLACRGGGPPYRRYGRRPLYRLADLIEWAEGRLSPLVRSTSEQDTSAGGSRRLRDPGAKARRPRQRL